MNSSHVRGSILDAIRLDLVGPCDQSEAKYLGEVLSINPSAYYLTGFLVPHGSRVPVDVEEDDANVSPDDIDENSESASEGVNAQIRKYPSSIGLSFLIKKETSSFEVHCRWGEYQAQTENNKTTWKRTHREKTVDVQLEDKNNFSMQVSTGVELTINQKILKLAGESYNLLEDGIKSVSVFLVNRIKIEESQPLDKFFLFQTEMEIVSNTGFCPRPNLRALESADLDDSIADLQFSSMHEYATGHGVATICNSSDGGCRSLKTSWIPSYEVEGVKVPEVPGLSVKMEDLAAYKDFGHAKSALEPLVSSYKKWIKNQESLIPKGIKKREDTGKYLLLKYDLALKRIEEGIELLKDKNVFESFKLANLTMAMAARQRRAYESPKTSKPKPSEIESPEWRTFQLAFILMNLKGIVDPQSNDRDTVDLLYFPTGGGKTEAYLGVAAFTLVYRRLVDPSICSAGVSILMRYTLRLLTLDQLERATTLICALEKIRLTEKEKWNLGEWPYEIGLWVGQAATPNKLGRVGDSNPFSARAMLSAYEAEKGKSPVPLEKCPWCGNAFERKNSFKLTPDRKEPTDLHVLCSNRDCDFSPSGVATKLPLVVVDEVIYRRLPCFIISTVDKLAAMTWDEKVGKLFGKVDKHHKTLGFYSLTEQVNGATRLKSAIKPIDLIIQDELHLISGPLGTMVGLYETAVDELSARVVSGKKVRAKVIASTATVRHAQKQVKSLFGRNSVDIFPVPGITAKDSFFAKTVPASAENPGRMYVGIAAQGRSTKNLLMRSYLTSMSAAQKQLDLTGDKELVDPYLTALGYFNSLRELGGARRIIEDSINSNLRDYSNRKRVNEGQSDILANRTIKFDVLELTSRVDTADVAAAKHRLSKAYGHDEFVNVAIATNMISVGLDITRLGLMLVFGQPKTTSEYIQASSRVGRGRTPGLVITLYNIHRHRDRSLYERFVPYHQSYYRDVETTSVTPFSTKALDKGLAGTYVSMARHLIEGMSRNQDASQIVDKKNEIKEQISKLLLERLASAGASSPAAHKSLEDRLSSLLDDWEKVMNFSSEKNEQLTYTGSEFSLVHQYLDPKLVNLPDYYLKFRANRSLRDVEPSVNVWVLGMNDNDLED